MACWVVIMIVYWLAKDTGVRRHIVKVRCGNSLVMLKEFRAAAARVNRTGVTTLVCMTVCYLGLSANLCYGIAGGFYYEKRDKGGTGWIEDAG